MNFKKTKLVLINGIYQNKVGLIGETRSRVSLLLSNFDILIGMYQE